MWWLELTRDKLIKGMSKSALVGVITDGGVAVLERRGPLDTIRDMGCGVTTGAVGAAATMLFMEYVKDSAPLGLIVGASASVATRYAYRSVLGPELKKSEEEEDVRKTVRHAG